MMTFNVRVKNLTILLVAIVWLVNEEEVCHTFNSSSVCDTINYQEVKTMRLFEGCCSYEVHHGSHCNANISNK